MSALASFMLAASTAAPEATPLELRARDRVVLVGGTFAERLAQFGHFEAIVAARRPELLVTFRSIAWPGDTPSLQPRPLNFGDVHEHLTRTEADVILLCFGMAESFDGPEGIARFESDLRQLIGSLAARTYNGESPPRLALVGPIAHERMGPHSADSNRHNADLREYNATMAKVAGELKLPFADLFTPTSELMSKGDAPLTINGIHASREGDARIAPLLAGALGLASGEPIALDAKGQTTLTVERAGDLLPGPGGTATVRIANLPAGRFALAIGDKQVAVADAKAWSEGVAVDVQADREAAERLRALVADKNLQFYYKHRAVNGEYIYGRRKEPFGVVNFPGEMSELDRLAAQGDAEIHRAAQALPTRTYAVTPARD